MDILLGILVVLALVGALVALLAKARVLDTIIANFKARPVASSLLAAFCIAVGATKIIGIPTPSLTWSDGIKGTAWFSTETNIVTTVVTNIVPYTAADYVQDGLVALFDGIENAGWGTHDNNASNWANLVNRDYDGIGSGIVTWTDNGWVNNVNGYPFTVGRLLADLSETRKYTIEARAASANYSRRMCFVSSYNSSPNKGLSIELNGYGGAGYIRYYNTNQPSAGWPCYTANDVPLTISFAVDYEAAQNVIAYKEGVQIGGGYYDIGYFELNGCDTVIGCDLNRPYMSWRGTYHALRVYDRQLTAEEMAHNYRIDQIRYMGVEGWKTNITTTVTTNITATDTVNFEWERDYNSSVAVPDTAAIIGEYRPKGDTNAVWQSLFTSTLPAAHWSGVVENATNYTFRITAETGQTVITTGITITEFVNDCTGLHLAWSADDERIVVGTDVFQVLYRERQIPSRTGYSAWRELARTTATEYHNAAFFRNRDIQIKVQVIKAGAVNND